MYSVCDDEMFNFYIIVRSGKFGKSAHKMVYIHLPVYLNKGLGLFEINVSCSYRKKDNMNR